MQLAELERAAAQIDALPSPDGVQLIRGDTVTAMPTEWMWRGYIARGKFHAAAGAPGTGKTTLALAVASTTTREGALWPDGTVNTEARDVLIWSGEDDAADTLKPRLMAMKADVRRIHFISAVRQGGRTRPFDPATDMDGLLVAARNLNPGLLILDPVVNMVRGNDHRGSEVRRGLQPMLDLLMALRCAGIGITHFGKGSQGREPIERILGSIAYAAVARIIFATARKPQDQGGGAVFVRAKSNVGPDGGGFEYRIEQTVIDAGANRIETSRIVWGTSLEGSARDILAAAEPQAEDNQHHERAAAEEWLKEVLKDGAMHAREVESLARNAGLAWRTVQRARDRLGIRPRREGFGRGASYVWTLPMPATDGPCVPSVPSRNAGTHGTHDEHGDADGEVEL